MPVKLRRLRYLIDQGDDGRLIFPDAEITTSGGSLRYGSGADVQTQIDAVVASVAAIDVHTCARKRMLC